MKKHILISFLVLALLALTLGVVSASESRTVFRTALAPPATIESGGHGNAVVVFQDDASGLSYKLVVNGLNDPTMAHIHVATEAGLNGPPVLWLYPAAPPASPIPGTFNGLLGSGSATSEDLTGAAAGVGVHSLADLRVAVEEGRAYVNVHTVANPGGEIRGTLH
jgi:hypothetical protein